MRLPKKCHSSVQSETAVAHPAWADSCSPGAGKGSRGDEETDAPLPMCFIWFFLFFQEPRVPLRLSRRVLLVVALQQNALSARWHPVSGGGGGGGSAPPGNGQQSIIPLIPASAWKAGATGLGLFQAKSSASKEEPEGFFFLSCSFHFVSSTGTQLLFSHDGISEDY